MRVQLFLLGESGLWVEGLGLERNRRDGFVSNPSMVGTHRSKTHRSAAQTSGNRTPSPNSEPKSVVPKTLLTRKTRFALMNPIMVVDVLGLVFLVQFIRKPGSAWPSTL